MRNRMLGVLATATVACVIATWGCTQPKKDNGPSGNAAPCGGGNPCAADPCGGKPCAGNPCGGETGGKSLEEMYPNWAEAQKLTGSVDRGMKLITSRMYDSFMTCTSCHSFDDRDTWTKDADAQARAGYSVWGAKTRTNIKGMDSSAAALGGNACVTTWMGGPKEGLSAQDLADLKAVLDIGGGADHATSKNLDYKGRKYTVPAKLTGGDAKRGAQLAMTYCNTCHAVEGKGALTGDVDKGLKGGVVPSQYLVKVAERIRDTKVPRLHDDGDYMPGFPDERLPEKDLLDLLAYFEKK